ncbi:DUF2442 domain-containing protein [Parapedobacter soli]|uniref:DUF2442 domain-containing protein n=1 Tax=Parapedobacter soli TaxID=416955 RepID=UPI0036F3E2D4
MANSRESISQYPRLKGATGDQLRNYQLIGKGTGVHWPYVDEDLSLKGFLKNSLRNIVYNKHKVA